MPVTQGETQAVTHPETPVDAQVETQPGTQPDTRPVGRAAGKPRARKSLARRAAGAVAGLALASAAIYAQTCAMPFEQRNSFLTTKGNLGQAIETNQFTVKVTSVSAAKAVDTKDFSGDVTKVGTSNLFLLTNVSATAPREPVQLSTIGPPVLLTADGKRYQPTDKVDQSLTLFNKWFQPGFWSSGVLVFEVPREALPGARLVFIPSVSAIVVDNFAPEAEIDLGLSDDATTRLISRAEEYHSLVNKTS
ncbi:DUF4352 domain-containing protein [Planotetraspora sp. A-T 1434]|uniref:DUF4352 domain-containing protein n=1 Tax=Planotetraspora sp. A-T 1434 TaxID=2979219 RepID=UPI0021C203E2|nr:DUF4352 domain-containing protein [Planotetraspora sp. A-T 1434]MCT9934764.1 DUF4352 domain-containing protein [Planotetraspora sp. A-T 1434]